MLYLLTFAAIVLVMFTQGIQITEPNGLIATGVILAMAVTYRNQRKHKRQD